MVKKGLENVTLMRCQTDRRSVGNFPFQVIGWNIIEILLEINLNCKQLPIFIKIPECKDRVEHVLVWMISVRMRRKSLPISFKGPSQQHISKCGVRNTESCDVPTRPVRLGYLEN